MSKPITTIKMKKLLIRWAIVLSVCISALLTHFESYWTIPFGDVGIDPQRDFQVLVSCFFQGLDLVQDHSLTLMSNVQMGTATRLALARSYLNLADCSPRPTSSVPFLGTIVLFPLMIPRSSKTADADWKTETPRWVSEAASIQSPIFVATLFAISLGEFEFHKSRVGYLFRSQKGASRELIPSR